MTGWTKILPKVREKVGAGIWVGAIGTLLAIPPAAAALARQDPPAAPSSTAAAPAAKKPAHEDQSPQARFIYEIEVRNDQ